MIIIATIAQDLHAQMVQAELDAVEPGLCRLVELDRLAQIEAMSYAVGYELPDTLVDSNGATFRVSDASVLWLRRVPAAQELRYPIDDERASTVMSNDCRGAALAFLRTHFRGRWISTIEATTLASDKITQLQAAADTGFRVPRTVISQSRAAIQQLLDDSGAIIVKTVAGVTGPMLQTIKLDTLDHFSDDQFMAAPAIYQEYIEGTDHLRVMTFGDESHAGIIRSHDVDWRGNLHVPVEQYAVDAELHGRIRAVLDRLDLEMGVMDLKVTPEGEIVWLEVNPQGQFAFLDGMTDSAIVRAFAKYLRGLAE